MPQIGDIAPDFELLNQDGQRVRLSDFRGKRVVLFAFPKADTPGCTAQACGFRDEWREISSANAVVLGLSTDAPAALQKWKQSKALPYDLLSDPTHAVLNDWGAWGASLMGLVKLPIASRSVWVIDEHGKVIEARVNIGPTESVQQALKVLETLPAHG